MCSNYECVDYPRRNHCRLYKSSSSLSWMKNRNEWKIKIKSSEICLGSDPVDVLMPWHLTMKEAKHWCEKYKGKLSIITSAEMRETLFSQMDNLTVLEGCAWPKCVAWTGFTDEDDEGIFVDLNEGKTLNFNPWMEGEPNGKENENCAISNKLSPKWFDAPCDNSYQSFCKMEGISRFHLRGNMIRNIQVNK